MDKSLIKDAVGFSTVYVTLVLYFQAKTFGMMSDESRSFILLDTVIYLNRNQL